MISKNSIFEHSIQIEGVVMAKEWHEKTWMEMNTTRPISQIESLSDEYEWGNLKYNDVDRAEYRAMELAPNDYKLAGCFRPECYGEN